MDTDFSYIALVEKELEDGIQSEMKAEFDQMRWNNCNDRFTVDTVETLVPERDMQKTENMAGEGQVYWKKSSDV